jgi:hypothetical protein
LSEQPKKLERDQALIGFFTRLAVEMQDQDNMLADILERQGKALKALESTEQYLRRKQAEVDDAHNKMMESFQHYRSDMLKLVNEQDIINKNIDDLKNVIKTTTYTLDNTNKMLSGHDERLSLHERKTGEQAEFAIKQQKVFQDSIDEVNKKFVKLSADTEKRLDTFQRETLEQLNKTSSDFIQLHADTEKRIDGFSRETTQQLEKFQHETTRRLLLLDSIVNSLETLLVRTDPDMKKRPWIVRVFGRISNFFRFKLPFLIKK